MNRLRLQRCLVGWTWRLYFADGESWWAIGWCWSRTGAVKGAARTWAASAPDGASLVLDGNDPTIPPNSG